MALSDIASKLFAKPNKVEREIQKFIDDMIDKGMDLSAIDGAISEKYPEPSVALYADAYVVWRLNPGRDNVVDEPLDEEEIMALGTATGLLDKRNPEGDVALFIKEYYKRKDSDKEVDPNFKVPERKKDLVIFDTDKFGLKEEFDRRIALRSEDIEVLEF